MVLGLFISKFSRFTPLPKAEYPYFCTPNGKFQFKNSKFHGSSHDQDWDLRFNNFPA
jgi:hypothetical protein